MTKLQVRPGAFVAVEIELKTRTRYKKVRVSQVTTREIVLDTKQRYDLEGFPLARDGQRKQITPETGVLIPLTPVLERCIERQALVDEICNVDWTMWMMCSDDMLHQVKALLQASLSTSKDGPLE